jgi:hypothetical protein
MKGDANKLEIIEIRVIINEIFLVCFDFPINIFREFSFIQYFFRPVF